MGHGNHFFRVYFFDDSGVFYDTFFKEHFVLLRLHFDCNLRSACLTPTVRGGKGTYSWGYRFTPRFLFLFATYGAARCSSPNQFFKSIATISDHVLIVTVLF